MTLPAFIAKISHAFHSVPVFFKVMGMALGLIVLLGAGMMWQIHGTWHGMLRKHLEVRGQLLGEDLAGHAAECLPTHDWSCLRSLVDELKSRSPDIAYLLVLDASGVIVASTLAEPVPPEISRAGAPREGMEARVAILNVDGETVRDVAVPVPGESAAMVRIGMSERRLNYEVGWLARRLVIVSSIIAALGMGAAWLLAGAIARPIHRLRETARSVKEGDYRVRAPVRTTDEIGDLAAAFNEMTAALQQKEAIRQGLLRRVIGAAEEERRRLARELHDQTGQSLTSLIAGLSAREARAADPAQFAGLVELRALAARTLSEIHDIASTLRPSSLDDVGLAPALMRHCRSFGRTSGVSVDCQTVGFDGERLPGELEVTVYRIVQEALTNAVRHGSAREVHVMLQRRDADLLVVVEDNGTGFDAGAWRARCLRGDHLGLLGIEERAALLGGSLRVESRPSSGTSLFVDIPIPRVDAC